MTRNHELVGWGEDGGTGGWYSLRVEPVEGQVELTLADAIPAEVRTAVVPGMPEPVDVGDCGVQVAAGFNGFCDAYGVRLYLVGTRRDGRLMCAEHAAERAGVPVDALPVLAMDAEEREYAADCIEDGGEVGTDACGSPTPASAHRAPGPRPRALGRHAAGGRLPDSWRGPRPRPDPHALPGPLAFPLRTWAVAAWFAGRFG